MWKDLQEKEEIEETEVIEEAEIAEEEEIATAEAQDDTNTSNLYKKPAFTAGFFLPKILATFSLAKKIHSPFPKLPV